MTTPVRAQATKRGISFLSIPASLFENAHSSQNKSRVIPTLKRLTPYGPIMEGEICLTRLRLVAKKKLVSKTAIWALVVARNGSGLEGKERKSY